MELGAIIWLVSEATLFTFTVATVAVLVPVFFSTIPMEFGEPELNDTLVIVTDGGPKS